MAKTTQVLENLNLYNKLNMRDTFSFVYENTKFSSKGLLKVTAFKCMKVKDITIGKKGSMVFEALVLEKSQTGYLYKGKPVSKDEWNSIAGFGSSEKEMELPMLHFRVDCISDLKKI